MNLKSYSDSETNLAYGVQLGRACHALYGPLIDIHPCSVVDPSILKCTLEPFCEKTGLRGFRPGPTQTGLYSHRRWQEA